MTHRKPTFPPCSSKRSRARAGLVVAVAAVAWATLAPSCQSGPLAPAAGSKDYQKPALVQVPGGLVNVAGGNLLLRRTDLVVDTYLGPTAIEASYNSATGEWLWSFDMSYDGASFKDGSGAIHPTGPVSPGAAIPGSVWVAVDGDTIRSKGGLVHQFGGAGRLVAVHWVSQSYPRLEFVSQVIAGAPRTTSIRQCVTSSSCSVLYTITRDGAGRVTQVEDLAGRRSAYTYTPTGELEAARDGLDLQKGWPGSRYEYTDGKLTAAVNSEAERVEYEYESGRLVAARAVGMGGDPSALHTLSHLGKDGQGLYRTRHMDPDANTTEFRYDAQRRVHRILNPVGESALATWDGLRSVSLTMPDGTVHTWTYHDDDVTTQIDPAGNELVVTYQSDGENRDAPFLRPIANAADSLGPILTRTYDAQGRLTSSTNGAGETRAFTHHPSGSIETLTFPNGAVATFSAYGNHGHPTEISVGDDTDHIVYDAVGNLQRSSDIGLEEPGVVWRRYDHDRNVREVVVSEQLGFFPSYQHPLTIDWRSDRRLRAVYRPQGGHSEFEYDSRGRLLVRRDRASGTWQSTHLEHDLMDRVTSVELPNGMRREIAYDEAGRVDAFRTLRDGILEKEIRVQYLDGRPISVMDSTYASPETFEYDDAGRITAVTFPGGERLDQFFDERSRVTTELFWTPTGDLLRALGFGYDGSDRETRILDGPEMVLQRVYSAGALAETRYGNGLTRTYGYDATTGRLTGMSTTDALGLEVETTTSAEPTGDCGSLGRRWSTATVGAFAGGSVTTFERNDLYPLADDPAYSSGRRVGSWATASLDCAQWIRVISYDALSNIESINGDGGPLNWTFEYNAEHNRLLRVRTGSQTVHSYAYDEAGFATSRDGEALSWTAAGQIRAIGTDHAFEWDAAGRPVATTAEGVTVTHRFGGRVVATGSGIPITMNLGEAEINLVTGTHLYRHFDARGNVKFVSDESGEIVTHYDYEPYRVRAVHGAEVQKASFARGVEMEDGLYLLGGRLYDGDAGRFLSPDPIAQLVNDFAYALSNPVWFWDPSGLAPSRVDQAARLRQEASALRGSASVFDKVATAFALAAAFTTPSPVSLGLAAVAATAEFTAIDLRNQASELERQADELLLEELREIQRRGGPSSGGPPLGSSFGFRLPFAHSLAPGFTPPSDPLPLCSPLALMEPGAARRWVAMAVGLQVLAALLLARGPRGREKVDR